jgi:hypothetical protein
MIYQHDFDPQLPALALALDGVAVGRLFADHWPAARGAPRPSGAIRACRLLDVKYQPAVRCVAIYELLVDAPRGPARPTIGVVELTPARRTHRLFNDDPHLPSLAAATDPGYMRERFATLPAAHDAAGVTACAVTPVRYKPGTHCVLRYDLQTPGGPRVVFGKLLGRGGAHLAATLEQLHAVSQAAPGMARVPRPLAYWPDLQLLIQPAVREGRDLNVCAFDPAAPAAVREQWLHSAGRSLAALHQSAGAMGPQRTLADDLRELATYCASLAQAAPALAERFTAAHDLLALGMRDLVEIAPLPSHGAFRTDQLMLEDGRLVLIDLDSFCWANPARDLGNFLADLRWKAIRNPAQAAAIEQAAGAFLAGYQAAGPLPPAAWRALYEAASLLKIAGRRFRNLSLPEWPLVPRLLDAAFAGLGPVRPLQHAAITGPAAGLF